MSFVVLLTVFSNQPSKRLVLSIEGWHQPNCILSINEGHGLALTNVI